MLEGTARLCRIWTRNLEWRPVLFALAKARVFFMLQYDTSASVRYSTIQARRVSAAFAR